MKNRFMHHAHIDEPTFKQIVGLFAEDKTAVEISKSVGVSRNSVNRLMTKIRRRIRKMMEESGKYTYLESANFHKARMKKFRGQCEGDGFSLHILESDWRFHFDGGSDTKGMRNALLKEFRKRPLKTNEKQNR